MPIACHLLFPPNPALVADLRECPGLLDEEALAEVERTPRRERARVDVGDLALEEDIYGRGRTPPAGTLPFLAPYAPIPVLMPADLHRAQRHRWKKHESPDSIGRFRLDFLCFVSHLARRHRLALEVRYEHERGDFPYETAWWVFDFTPGAVVQELFGISSHDEGGWGAELVRLADGRLRSSLTRAR